MANTHQQYWQDFKLLFLYVSLHSMLWGCSLVMALLDQRGLVVCIGMLRVCLANAWFSLRLINGATNVHP